MGKIVGCVGKFRLRMISLFPCAQRATLTKHFSGSIKDLEPRGTVVESYARGEGPMGLIAGFFVAAVLAGTGIYNPQLMHNGRCMAESGGLYALYYCTPETAAPARPIRR